MLLQGPLNSGYNLSNLGTRHIGTYNCCRTSLACLPFSFVLVVLHVPVLLSLASVMKAIVSCIQDTGDPMQFALTVDQAIGKGEEERGRDFSFNLARSPFFLFSFFFPCFSSSLSLFLSLSLDDVIPDPPKQQQEKLKNQWDSGKEMWKLSP